jgi:succinate dehydrogenase / fumarate reductase membrane anchor subunit
MSSSPGLGAKRAVVGAHYGLIDWLAQRVTAVVLIAYILVGVVWFLLAHDFSYRGWSSLFANEWMKILTFLALISLFYHVWIGMRDIWMDYLKSAMLRLAFELLTILWLFGCAGYSVQTLWSV